MVNGPYKAEYRCLNCKHRFDIMQGPGAPSSAKVCPKCEHKWVEWLNYEALRKNRFSRTVPY